MDCYPYESFYSQFEHLLNNSSLSKQGPNVPRMDLHEDREKNLVTAIFELCGVSKDDIHINIQNGKLTVSAETKNSEDHAEAGYILRERFHGKFSHTLQLPQGVQEEQIKAALENGVLTITFPKTLPEHLPKKIMIQS